MLKAPMENVRKRKLRGWFFKAVRLRVHYHF